MTTLLGAALAAGWGLTPALGGPAAAPPGSVPAARSRVLELDGSGTRTGGEVRSGPLRAVLEIRRRTLPDDLLAFQPVVRVSLDGRAVGELIGAERVGGNAPVALLQVAEMDPTNPWPEVLLSSFTGGAHCCNDTRVLSSEPGGGRWREIRLEPVDGVTRAASDPIGDGRFVLVDVDDRFLYAFASYAGSAAPSLIRRLEGDRFVDVSREAAYRPVHRRDLARMSDWFRDAHAGEEVNGFLAGYVASKQRVGEAADGWARMLRRYDRRSDWGLTQCFAGFDDQGRCLGPQVRYRTYPEALRAFLREAGYPVP